jgi:hypothetical protein
MEIVPNMNLMSNENYDKMVGVTRQTWNEIEHVGKEIEKRSCLTLYYYKLKLKSNHHTLACRLCPNLYCCLSAGAY